MTTQPPVFGPRRRWKLVLADYAAGFLISDLLFLFGAYQSGGFDRPHTFADFLIIGSVRLAIGLLWPVVLAVLILQLSGFFPIQFSSNGIDAPAAPKRTEAVMSPVGPMAEFEAVSDAIPKSWVATQTETPTADVCFSNSKFL